MQTSQNRDYFNLHAMNILATTKLRQIHLELLDAVT
jgi:hypothetical protein